MARLPCCGLFPLLFLLWAAAPATAHNGRLALAYPLTNIAIDGDLSAWPEDMVRHPIEMTELGDVPGDRADFQASFRIGYSAAENALYLAVEVEDESSVTNRAPVEVGWSDWNQEDGCEVFLDLAHQESHGPIFMAVIYGEDRKMIVEPGTQTWEHVELGVRRTEGTHRYEWKLDIDGISAGTVRLGPAMTVGVDVAVGDRDADGSFTWTSWGREVTKNRSPERLGDAVLVDSRTRTGRLSGKVRWEGREQGVARRKVRLQSLTGEKLWVRVETDQQGNFAAELPAGAYLARLNEPEQAGVEVELGRAEESHVELRAPLPRGISRPAGPGKAARSGPGIRDGDWHFWGVPDGLLSFDIQALCQDRRGDLWIGTRSGGVSRYDGETFTTFTADGLPSYYMRSMIEDRDGNLWFGTGIRARDIPTEESSVLCRYDGEEYTSFKMGDVWGHPTIEAPSMTEVQTGHLWFGSNSRVARFDGEHFTQSLLGTGNKGRVNALLGDREGNLWVGTGSGGLGLYEGQVFTAFTQEDSLTGRVQPFYAKCILEDREGNLWFGTWNGVSRFDGKTFTHFTEEDGLADNRVQCILSDREGNLWFGTNLRGISRFDGQVWQSLLSQDGLPDDRVYDILQDRRGDIWIATGKGVVRYHPPQTAPPVLLTDVVTDRRHGPVPELQLPTTQNYLAFEFQGKSFRTRPNQMVYLYCLEGYDPAWRQTRERRVEYADLPRGEYRFQVKAVDLDLNYSATPVEVKVRVHFPYERIAWIAALSLSLLLVAWQTARIVRRDLKLQRVNQTLQQQTADLEETNRQLRDTQTQLVQAEKMTTLGLLAGGVAHELNNPLQTLLAGSQRILRFPDDLERHCQSASLMERAAQHGSAIVQNLLNYTRRSREEVQDVDLNEVVDSTLSLLQHQLEQGEIALEVSRGELPPIQGNFAELCTVVTNLVINARDAVLSVSRDDGGQPSIRIAIAATPAGVVLSVRDSGPGIPAELRERIFDPFFTTKEVGAGTGLGLSIVQGIVERHGGSIAVESAEGQGMTFTVNLPAGQRG